ncbi:MAG: tRNA-dihydrouridine synthase family protein [Patescibacteria group bacterium]|nr:tRNA-dihydrouridine synthase family protein [Patescibacteria group bacterium]
MKEQEQNFWQELKKRNQSILALAPMAGFTDIAFRQICSAYGADVVYSEMASATALFYNQENDDNETLRLLRWDRTKESRYLVQLFGSNPEHFALAARLICEKIKPNGLDINFGCPVGKVLKQGAGADLMKNLKQTRLVIESVLENSQVPVSVKIRAKAGDVSALEFVKNISDLPVSALMIHGRSLNQGFVGEVDFGLVKTIRPYFKGPVLINGGIVDLKSAQSALNLSGADGLGLARGALARPWLFQEIKEGREIIYNRGAISRLLYRHALSLVELKGESALLEWRKQACWYVQGLEGASQWRGRLVQVSTLTQLENILKDYGLND